MTDYDWDIRCADWELRRLQDGFTGYDHANFARILALGYGRALADVHVETGSLKGSMKFEITESDDDTWEGFISAGGASTGPKNPVKYALEEKEGTSPRYGGPPSHDYFRNLEHIDDDMMGPFTSFFARGRRTPHPELGGL